MIHFTSAAARTSRNKHSMSSERVQHFRYTLSFSFWRSLITRWLTSYQCQMMHMSTATRRRLNDASKQAQYLIGARPTFPPYVSVFLPKVVNMIDDDYNSNSYDNNNKIYDSNHKKKVAKLEIQCKFSEMSWTQLSSLPPPLLSPNIGKNSPWKVLKNSQKTGKINWKLSVSKISLPRLSKQQHLDSWPNNRALDPAEETFRISNSTPHNVEVFFSRIPPPTSQRVHRIQMQVSDDTYLISRMILPGHLPDSAGVLASENVWKGFWVWTKFD